MEERGISMKETIKKLELAYENLMKIPVSGYSVEPMASAMHLIRDVFIDLDAIAQEEAQKEGAENGQNH